MHLIFEYLYNWDGANVSFFYVANNYHTAEYDRIMAFGSALGKYTLFPAYLVLFIVYAWLSGRRLKGTKAHAVHKYEWQEALSVFTLGYAFSLLWVPQLKHYFHMPRPFAALPHGTVYVPEIVRGSENPMTSFPSGHTEFATLLVLSLWPALGGTGRFIALVYLAWVLFSRCALGMHFPADVAWTFVLSAAAVLLVRTILGKVYFKGSVKY